MGILAWDTWRAWRLEHIRNYGMALSLKGGGGMWLDGFMMAYLGAILAMSRLWGGSLLVHIQILLGL